jgi:hypothetical protein
MIALIHNGLNTVAAYYRMFSTDSTWSGHLTIQPRDIHRLAFASFFQFLERLRSFIRGGENKFLVACHGNPNGFPIPIVPGTTATANYDLLNELDQLARTGSETLRDNLLLERDERNRPVFRNRQQLDSLVDLIRDVQQVRIEHLEFRCCNLGAGQGLRAVHDILGCRHTVAPRVYFGWSLGPLATAGVHARDSAAFQRRAQALGFPRRLFTRFDCLQDSRSGVPNTDLALGLSLTANAGGEPSGIYLDAVNSEAILGWTQYYLEDFLYWPLGQVPPGGGYRRGGPLPLMGLENRGNDTKPLLFPGDAFDYLEKLAVENTP